MSIAVDDYASAMAQIIRDGVMRASMPDFAMKHAAALQTVTKALKRSKRPYIAFSGGKDSMAVLTLVHTVNPNVPLHWSDDELEYDETVAVMTQIKEIAGDQLVISHGWATHAGWFRPWRDEPYWRDPLPGTLFAGMDSDDWMATRGHDMVFTGLRKDESGARRDFLAAVQEVKGSPIYRVNHGTGQRCCPLADWTTDDVFALLAITGMPINPVYAILEAAGVSRGRSRVGPLPLTPRDHLVRGWDGLIDRLETRYGRRWS
jgi:phosphoadenosine phosphosulfate reductase